MLKVATIERLQKILEKKTGDSVSFEEAAEAADICVGFFAALFDE